MENEEVRKNTHKKRKKKTLVPLLKLVLEKTEKRSMMNVHQKTT
jgi:hypothetical protein